MGLEPTTPLLANLTAAYVCTNGMARIPDERCLWHRLNVHERRMFPKMSQSPNSSAADRQTCPQIPTDSRTVVRTALGGGNATLFEAPSVSLLLTNSPAGN